jgi:hypothetical protein
LDTFESILILGNLEASLTVSTIREGHINISRLKGNKGTKVTDPLSIVPQTITYCHEGFIEMDHGSIENIETFLAKFGRGNHLGGLLK